MESPKTAQRMMLAGGFMVAGLVVLGISKVTGSAGDALGGGRAEESMPAQDSTGQGLNSARKGVIHVEPGDPFPPATPLLPTTSKAAAEGDQPIPRQDEASRQELIQQIISLHTRVAELEADQARLREELKKAGAPAH